MFAEHILGSASGHYFYSVDHTLSYWETAPLSERELHAFKARLKPHEFVVMINEKARIPLPVVRRVFGAG